MALTWEGKRVSNRMRRAMIAAVNATMGAAVVHAKRNHAWQNRTGTLEGSIDIQEFARVDRGAVRGLWGSRDVRYARIHELGGTIVPKRAKALVFEPVEGGGLVMVKKVTIPARPYLRPAADVQYPTLAKRIRKAYEARARGAGRRRRTAEIIGEVFGPDDGGQGG